jgi:hypothetical protein
LFPDQFADKDYTSRPTSIGDAESTLAHADVQAVSDCEAGTDKEVGDVDMEVDRGTSGDKVSDVGDNAIVVDEATPAPGDHAAGDKTVEGVTPTTTALALPSTTRAAPSDELDPEEAYRQAKRRRLNEIRRYDVDSGGAVGVGMGTLRDDDRVVIDDLDPK